MAGVGLVQDLCEEATCPICLDYFKDPVMIPGCGHNLCKGCLDCCLGEAEIGTCPQCRHIFQRRSTGANRQLANMVETVRKLSLRGAEGEERVCEQHQKPKHLFCKDDKTLICVACERKEHQNHETLLLEEAAQECTTQIWNCLEALRQEREKIEARKGDIKKESQDLLEQLKAERKMSVKAFKQLRQFLDEQENYLLAQIEDTVNEIERVMEDHLWKLSEELQSLERNIEDLEDMILQPAADLLQNIEKFTESSHQKAQSSEDSEVTPSAELKRRIFDFRDIHSFLKGVMEQFKETFLSGLLQEKVDVHLDSDTAHPNLIVSADSKCLRWTEMRQELPDNPERFDYWPCVLGCENFTKGRYFWEVFVGSDEEWSVGVSRKTVKRKGNMTWWAEKGIWYMGKWGGKYQSFNMDTFVISSEEPRKIQVTLNCEGRRIAFYDAERGTLICESQRSSFTTENLQPFFYARHEAQLSLTS